MDWKTFHRRNRKAKTNNNITAQSQKLNFIFEFSFPSFPTANYPLRTFFLKSLEMYIFISFAQASP